MKRLPTLLSLCLVAACSQNNRAPEPSSPPVPSANPAEAPAEAPQAATAPSAVEPSDTATAAAPSAAAPSNTATERKLGYLFYYAADKSFVLSTSMCESFPPQACGTTTELAGLTAEQAAPFLNSDPSAAGEDDVMWSEEPVALQVAMSGKSAKVLAIGPAEESK